MKINIRKININYIQYGSGSDIVLLHGWGQNIEMMKPLGDNFQKKYRITIIDLPGFGQSDEPEHDLTVSDYSDILKELLDSIGVKNPIVIGHSFGGRVAIVYSANNPVKKLVLFGSPCIRHDEKMSLKTKTLKTLKKVPGLNKLEGFAKKHIGSTDYKNASPLMRQILDAIKYARKSNVPVVRIKPREIYKMED